MVCHEMRLGLSVCLAALVVAGCSSRSDSPPSPKAVTAAPLKPAEPAPPQPKAETPPPAQAAAPAPEKERPASEPAVASSKEEPKPKESAKDPAPERKPDPFEGLTAEEVSVFKRVGDYLEPVPKGAAAAYGELLETKDRAKAAMRLSNFKVSLNQEAEKRVRALAIKAKETDSMVQAYVNAVQPMWPTVAGFSGKFNPSRDALRAAYEKALDEGVEFPPEIRRSLGAILKFEGFQEPAYAINIDDLVDRLRSNLLDQSVTGDYLFLMARAVKERADEVKRRREWTASFYELVNVTAIPFCDDEGPALPLLVPFNLPDSLLDGGETAAPVGEQLRPGVQFDPVPVLQVEPLGHAVEGDPVVLPEVLLGPPLRCVALERLGVDPPVVGSLQRILVDERVMRLEPELLLDLPAFRDDRVQPLVVEQADLLGTAARRLLDFDREVLDGLRVWKRQEGDGAVENLLGLLPLLPEASLAIPVSRPPHRV